MWHLTVTVRMHVLNLVCAPQFRTPYVKVLRKFENKGGTIVTGTNMYMNFPKMLYFFL
jgi:hypothetical protein